MGLFARFFGYKTGVAIYTRPEPIASTPAEALPAVVRAVNLISADIARLEIVIRGTDGKVIPDHPAASILTREASRWQSGFELRRFVTAVALHSGNGLAIIRRANDGTVAELQPVPDGAMNGELTESGIVYRIGNTTLSSDQVIHVGAYPDPLNPAWFRGPLDAARFCMNMAADQESLQSSLTKTGVGKIQISHPGAMSDQTVQAIRDAWANMHATAEGAARPLILREGMKAERLGGDSASNMDARRYSVQEVARAFGVPPEMLFQQGGGALSSQAETARAYVDSALSAWIAAWCAEVQRKLCAPGETVSMDTTPLLRGNLKDAGVSLSKLTLSGIMSPNDARRYIGLDPVDGMDDPTVTMPGGSSAAANEGGEDNA